MQRNDNEQRQELANSGQCQANHERVEQYANFEDGDTDDGRGDIARHPVALLSAAMPVALFAASPMLRVGMIRFPARRVWVLVVR